MTEHHLEAVLFDLDGTLLDNDMDVFLPRYLERLAARVAGMVPPRQFVAHLLKATQSMTENDGRATNEEVFAATFYPLIGRPRAEMEPIFMDFYRHDFPALRAYTRPIAGARAAVEAAFERGLDVVIATNPLFPAIAIEERLEWAGIGDFPYRLITSYENSHACKPNPLYYREILDAIGRPAEATLVVGNEPLDMAAGSLGCLTFLVPGPATVVDPPPPEPAYRGTLAEVEVLLRAGGKAG